MKVEVHAPSWPVLVVGVLLALIAIIYNFVPGANMHVAFWIAIAAYVVAALGSMMKT
jgi:hypothetical protein